MPTLTLRHFLGIDWQISRDHRTDTWVFLAYWIFALPIFWSSYNDAILPLARISSVGYAVIAYSICAWICVNLIMPTFLVQRRYVAAMFSVILVILTCSFGTELLFATLFKGGFSWASIVKNHLGNDAQNILTIVAILAGKKYFDERQRNTALESERRQSELQRLRAQVDPHFLFNSLNILDILIDDDPARAKLFVHRLSNLYRYLIRHREEDIVPAAEEIAYARDYHYLVEERFGKAFRFRQNLSDTQHAAHYVPPGSLQTVLENVYKHNLATERNPVTITLEQRGDALFVTNDFVPKPGKLATHETSGSGIANLLRRYALLTDSPAYSRLEDQQWVVRLPLLVVERATSSKETKPGITLPATR